MVGNGNAEYEESEEEGEGGIEVGLAGVGVDGKKGPNRYVTAFCCQVFSNWKKLKFLHSSVKTVACANDNDNSATAKFRDFGCVFSPFAVMC